MKAFKILIVATSHDTLGATGLKTGIWLEEFAAPWYYWLDQGCQLTLASPLGGVVPVDPASLLPQAASPATQRYGKDLSEPLRHSVALSEMHAGDFDAVFYPGGHGPLWDLAQSDENAKLLSDFHSGRKLISAVCHGPAALLKARDRNGIALVSGKQVTAFSNAEEVLVSLEHIVPFSVENALKEAGALYTCAAPWHEHVVVDHWLVTGQNPGSSLALAKQLYQMLTEKCAKNAKK